MNEEEIRAEMRLYVLEVFATNLLAVNCLLANPKDPMAMIERLSKQNDRWRSREGICC
jgi:hypothetical protein